MVLRLISMVYAPGMSFVQLVLYCTVYGIDMVIAVYINNITTLYYMIAYNA